MNIHYILIAKYMHVQLFNFSKLFNFIPFNFLNPLEINQRVFFSFHISRYAMALYPLKDTTRHYFSINLILFSIIQLQCIILKARDTYTYEENSEAFCITIKGRLWNLQPNT